MSNILDEKAFPFGKESTPEECRLRSKWDRAMARECTDPIVASCHVRTADEYDALAVRLDSR